MVTPKYKWLQSTWNVVGFYLLMCFLFKIVVHFRLFLNFQQSCLCLLSWDYRHEPPRWLEFEFIHILMNVAIACLIFLQCWPVRSRPPSGALISFFMVYFIFE